MGPTAYGVQWNTTIFKTFYQPPDRRTMCPLYGMVHQETEHVLMLPGIILHDYPEFPKFSNIS